MRPQGIGVTNQSHVSLDPDILPSTDASTGISDSKLNQKKQLDGVWKKNPPLSGFIVSWYVLSRGVVDYVMEFSVKKT